MFYNVMLFFAPTRNSIACNVFFFFFLSVNMISVTRRNPLLVCQSQAGKTNSLLTEDWIELGRQKWKPYRLYVWK